MSKEKSAYRELMEKGEEKLIELASELLKNDTIASAVEKSMDFVFDTRKSLFYKLAKGHQIFYTFHFSLNKNLSSLIFFVIIEVLILRTP